MHYLRAVVIVIVILCPLILILRVCYRQRGPGATGGGAVHFARVSCTRIPLPHLAPFRIALLHSSRVRASIRIPSG